MLRVTFTKLQIDAIRQEIERCLECSQIDGEFNPYSFHGAVETSLDTFSNDGYLFFDDSEV